MSHEHILLEAADSGRGSWTSCSSSSHDNFQSLPNPKSWDFLNTYRHTHLDDPIAEVEPTDCEPCACPKGGCCSRTCGQCKGSLETSQLRQSWASSSSLSDIYEPNYGTVKRRVLESAPAEAPDGLEPRDTTDPVYKTVTSSTDRGLIGKYKFVSLVLRGYVSLTPKRGHWATLKIFYYFSHSALFSSFHNLSPQNLWLLGNFVFPLSYMFLYLYIK